MSQLNKNSAKDQLSRMRNDIDRQLEETKNLHQFMATPGVSDVQRLGVETIQKSLEHTRAIINQTEASWDREFAGSASDR